jgi:hypothetical protein
MKTSVGFNFASNAQSLWLPYYLNLDTGLLSGTALVFEWQFNRSTH